MLPCSFVRKNFISCIYFSDAGNNSLVTYFVQEV